MELLNALLTLGFVAQAHEKAPASWFKVASIATYNVVIVIVGKHFLYIHLIKIYFEIRAADWMRHKCELAEFLNLVYTHLLS